MLKLTSSYSKKVPAEEQYSSKQYHASIEIELSDAVSPEQLQEKIHQTFSMVRNTVENEINGNGTSKPTPVARTNGDHPAPGGKTNGSSKASNAQIKFMTSLATEQDIRLSALNAYAKDNFGVETIYDLTKKDASALVDALKRNKVKIAA